MFIPNSVANTKLKFSGIQIQSTPDNLNLLQETEKSSSYREFEVNDQQ